MLFTAVVVSNGEWCSSSADEGDDGGNDNNDTQPKSVKTKNIRKKSPNKAVNTTEASAVAGTRTLTGRIERRTSSSSTRHPSGDFTASSSSTTRRPSSHNNTAARSLSRGGRFNFAAAGGSGPVDSSRCVLAVWNPHRERQERQERAEALASAARSRRDADDGNDSRAVVQGQN